MPERPTRDDRDEQLQPFAGIKFLLIAEFCDWSSFDQLHHEIGSSRVGRSGIQHFGDIGMIHHGQRLPLGFKSSHNLVRIHARFDDLESHFAADRFFLLGHINSAHAASADLLKQFVRADLSAGAFRDQPVERDLQHVLGR